MKALLQRVSGASVKVEGKEVSSIRKGLLVFLGVEKGDTGKETEYLCRKIARLRIFEDREGKMNLSVREIGGEVLVVSQFTLAADLKRGNRPSFDNAESPKRAEDIYRDFISCIAQEGIPVKGGVFGAMMDVELVNNGPVTFMLESRTEF